jgi:hypothetical protein
VPYANDIITARIIFLSTTDHTGLASFSMGGKVQKPITIPAGEHASISFPLNENFMAVAGVSKEISLFLVDGDKIFDRGHFVRKDDKFIGE